MRRERQIIFHRSYFQEFFLKVGDPVREKIGYVFRVIETVDRIPEKFLKHVEGTDGLFEIRVESTGNIYRIFCCFDLGNLVVLFNAFQKKTQKTPSKEIEKAVKLRDEYFKSKTVKDKEKRSNKKR